MFRKLIATAAVVTTALTAIVAIDAQTNPAPATNAFAIAPAEIDHTDHADHEHAGHDHDHDHDGDFSLTTMRDGFDGQSLAGFTNKTIASLQTFWGEIYAQNGVDFPNNVNVAYLMPGEDHELNVNCGGACYRGAGDLIIFEHATARGYFSWGDMAFATVVAHEYAHNVQSEAGLFNTGRTQQSMELMADCFSGLYVGWAERQGMLSANDLIEARYEVYMVGDDANPESHGTRQQRLDAFNVGYAGNLANCTTTY